MKKQYIQPSTTVVMASLTSCLMVSRSYEVGDQTNQGISGNVQDGNDYSGQQRSKENSGYDLWENE